MLPILEFFLSGIKKFACSFLILRSFLYRHDVSFFIISGIGIALATNYPQKLWWLSLISITPILYWFYIVRVNKQRGFVYSYISLLLFFILYTTLSTLYILRTYPLDWLGIESLFLNVVIIAGSWLIFIASISIISAFWSLIILFTPTTDRFSGVVLGSSFWIGLEYVRSWMVGFATHSSETLLGAHHTYYVFGYLVAHAPFINTLLAIGGIYLGSFFIVLCNYVVLLLLTKRYVASIVLITLISCILIVSNLYIHNIRNYDTDISPIKITLINTHTKFDIKNIGNPYRKEFDFVKKIVNDNGITVLPEQLTILPFYQREQSEYHNGLLIGPDLLKQGHSRMFFFDQKRNTVDYISKQLLMPVGEYNVSWVDFLLNKVHDLGWMTLYQANSLSSNEFIDRKTQVYTYHSNPGVVIGGSICSENISPILHRLLIQGGSTILINIRSHDAFNASKILSKQTLAVNTARAIETGRPLIVSSNRGWGYVIKNDGTLLAISTSTDPISVIHTSIHPKIQITPYMKYGDLIIYASFFILICSLRPPQPYLKKIRSYLSKTKK